MRTGFLSQYSGISSLIESVPVNQYIAIIGIIRKEFIDLNIVKLIEAKGAVGDITAVDDVM